MERLQKVISQAGIASRRESESIITAGRVTVNGKVVTELGVKVDPVKDKVRVDGKLIRGEKLVYLLLFKPKGVVSTLSDPEGRETVAQLVSDAPQRVYPVGRLDYNTEGALLLTNDGELTHALLHPSRHVKKTYIARVKGIPAEEKLDKLRTGIKLDDGMTAPAEVYLLEADQQKGDARIEITIHEGRNHQVRRMCDAIGYSVKQLKRVSFAFLTLEGLKRGQYRSLTDDEVKKLKLLASEENKE
ncbi:pseudouridine synthase [Anaerosporomusa subterranea]|uniref:Pseudouridine synthase n=1 Tax=Anaerosporomusa subterranea TaxID=1794912 RepID=A0A154BTX8_ANASB|nr:pseudouridine synthase [Anaerosporomusa subterranea]KYZ77473.1 pseudouridine synthase [Anaerosporomusa subterranea]